MKKKVLTFSLAATLMFSGAAMTTQSALAAPEASKAEVTQKIKDIEKAVADNDAEVKSALAEIDASNELLDKIEKEMEDLKAIIEKREDKLDDSARSVQIIGQADSIVDFLFRAESLTDLIGRMDTVYLLLSANQETINKQKDDQKKLADKESEAQAENEHLMQLAANLESKKSELQDKLSDANKMLASIKDKEAREAARKQLAAATGNADTQVTTASSSVSRASESSAGTTANETTNSSSSNSSSSSQASAAPSVNGNSIVANAYANSGSPYVWGGSSPAGFDCSGFTSYVYAQSGKSIPRSAGAQMGASKRISFSEAQPGDLVFFNQFGSIDHVGIYLGGGQYIGAQNPRSGITVESITSGYWSNYVAGFGRF